MNTPPSAKAVNIGSTDGVPSRTTASGRASSTVVVIVSRRPSSASGRKKRPSSTLRTKSGWSQIG